MSCIHNHKSVRSEVPRRTYIGCPSLFPFTNFQGCFYFTLTRVLPPSLSVFFSHSLFFSEHIHTEHFQTHCGRASMYFLISRGACAYSHCWLPLVPHSRAWLRRPFPLCILIFVFIPRCTVATLSALISILVTRRYAERATPVDASLHRRVSTFCLFPE